MGEQILYTQDEFERDVSAMAEAVQMLMMRDKLLLSGIYGVPRGGVLLAYAVGQDLIGKSVVNGTMSDEEVRARPDILVVDDIVDSGATRAAYASNPFFALHAKKPFDAYRDIFGHSPFHPTMFLREVGEVWIKYWWEVGSEDQGPEHNITRLLEYIGEDPNREGLKETPTRVLRSYDEIFAGYKADPESVFTIFDGEEYDQMVLLRDVELYSVCEHHMQPFFGKAHIAYIADGKIIGVSKLARLMEIFSRRLQVQERIGEQIVDALMKHLKPKGAACVIEARHMCMCARGVGKQNSIMVTSSLRGAFKDEDSARAEFMNLIRS